MKIKKVALVQTSSADWLCKDFTGELLTELLKARDEEEEEHEMRTRMISSFQGEIIC